MINIAELDFCQEVEKIAKEDGSYIEAVIRVCEDCGIDIAFGAKLLSRPIIEKIQKEGESGNLLPKISKLPI